MVVDERIARGANTRAAPTIQSVLERCRQHLSHQTTKIELRVLFECSEVAIPRHQPSRLLASIATMRRCTLNTQTILCSGTRCHSALCPQRSAPFDLLVSVVVTVTCSALQLACTTPVGSYPHHPYGYRNSYTWSHLPSSQAVLVNDDHL
jgi:hypothetical protein